MFMLRLHGQTTCNQSLTNQTLQYQKMCYEAKPIATTGKSMNEGNRGVKKSAVTINQSRQITIILQLVPVSIHSCGKQVEHICFPR